MEPDPALSTWLHALDRRPPSSALKGVPPILLCNRAAYTPPSIMRNHVTAAPT